jgi:lipoprotein-anchoring transpeptidase ErfK/SrfK
METPLGLYQVAVRFTPRTQPFLGTFAFETTAYSKLSEWPGGGVVGLHGTTQPWLLGQAVSHGCVRISNEAADYLKRRVPVGTPIRIVRS